MNKEEIDNLENYLKNILPKSKSTLSISAFGSVDLEDLMNNIKQLKKVPNYNDLLKENVKLKGKLEEKQKIIDKLLRKYNEETCTIDFSMTIEDFNQLLEMLEIGKNE